MQVETGLQTSAKGDTTAQGETWPANILLGVGYPITGLAWYRRGIGVVLVCHWCGVGAFLRSSGEFLRGSG